MCFPFSSFTVQLKTKLNDKLSNHYFFLLLSIFYFCIYIFILYFFIDTFFYNYYFLKIYIFTVWRLWKLVELNWKLLCWVSLLSLTLARWLSAAVVISRMCRKKLLSSYRSLFTRNVMNNDFRVSMKQTAKFVMKSVNFPISNTLVYFFRFECMWGAAMTMSGEFSRSQ